MTFPSLASLRGVIEEIPPGLDELYLGIINQIMDGTQELQKLLVWVIYGRQPLTLKELEVALATQMDSKSKKSTEYHRTELISTWPRSA